MSVLTRIHGDMKPILPAPGGKQTPCSVAYRKVGNRYVLAVNLSKIVAYDLGFNVVTPSAPNYAEIGFHPDTGTLVLVNVSDTRLPSNDAIRWKLQLRQGTIVAMFRPHWLEGLEAHYAAERCEFKVLDDSIEGIAVKFIEITVPAWAAPNRKYAAVQTVSTPTRLLAGVPHTRPGAPK